MAISLNSPLVDTDWLADHLADPAIRILDCTLVMKPNADGSYGFVPGIDDWSAGHIPNSIYVDVGAELSDPEQDITLMMPPPARLAETFREKGIGDGTAVICYDRGNHAWAARVWWLLRTLGFDNAAVLDGGWKKWRAEGREESLEESAYPPAAGFTVRPRPTLMADKHEVLAACHDDDTLLLHSLPAAMFNGEVNPYPRPGRIPGSKNLYCETLIDGDSNCYISRETMTAKLDECGSLSSKRVITYCGGGIAASSNALALTLAGHDNVAVYDGSLTEWTADPDLPMELP